MPLAVRCGCAMSSKCATGQATRRLADILKIPAGKAVIAGTRLAVEFILALLVAGESGQVLMANYPALARENILACLSYAG